MKRKRIFDHRLPFAFRTPYIPGNFAQTGKISDQSYEFSMRYLIKIKKE